MKAKLKHQNKFGIIAAALFLLIVPAYFARGWIRGPVASTVSTHMYGPAIDKAFANKTEPINKRFQRYNVNIKDNDPTDKGKASCFDGNFHYVQETVICGRWVSSYRELVPNQLRKDWPHESQQLNAILKDAGWQPDNRYPISGFEQITDLRGLLNEKAEVVRAPYVNHVGAVECTLEIRYDPAYEDIPPALSVEEYCGRTIDIFGGFKGY